MRNANPQRIYFSQIEKVDLVKALLGTSLAFGIFFVASEGYKDLSFSTFVFYIMMAAITAGSGFILHELAHKFTAHHFGVHSEFRSHDSWLLLSLIVAFLGFIIAAPGAVYIFGNISKRENGIISMAGPLTNIVLAAGFLATVFLYPATTLLHAIGMYGFFINAFLAMFNMIPFLDFDGAKVWRWNKVVYIIMALVSVGFVIASFIMFEGSLA